MSDPLDRRLHVYRPDLADIRLKGRVEAGSFRAGESGHVIVPVVDLKAVPERGAGTESQLLLNEPIAIFERSAGWCWVQSQIDGYVGYIESDACASGTVEPTHRVVVPRTFVYPDADLRFPPVSALSAGSLVDVCGEAETRGTRYFRLSDGGAVIACHCLPADEIVSTDYVAIARRFMATPYLWGGRSGFGIDCSGLVQLSLALAGFPSPRDSDMQAAGLGHELDPGENFSKLERGDFVFWKGHVGMMEDRETLLHADGHTMSVTCEPLAEAVARNTPKSGPPTVCRRLAVSTGGPDRPD